MEKYEAWVKENIKNLSERDADVLSRSARIISENECRDGKKHLWGNKRVIFPAPGTFNGIWNWDSAFHAICVSRWDGELAWDCLFAMLERQTESGLIPDVIWDWAYEKDGKVDGVVDTFTKPPVFPWAIEIVYRRDKNISNLKKAYPYLVKNEEFWRTKRFDGCLFHYDCDDKNSAEYNKLGGLESGWDNSVRWDKIPVCNLRCVDENSFMLGFYKSMEFIASELSLSDDIAKWNKRKNELAETIENKLWCEEKGCYLDRDVATDSFSDCMTPASFMPLFVGCASKEHAEKMAKIAREHFLPAMPTVSYDNPEFSPDYWRGPSWINTAYFAAKGLKDYGHNEGEVIKNTLLDWASSHKEGIYENYDAKTGEGLHAANFSWSCAFFIEFILNF